MASNEIGVHAMEISDRFITDRADVPQSTDGMKQPQKASSVSLEILKRLDYWYPCEVPTLLNLTLSHVIAYLLHQDEKPFEATAEPFERCFSRVPVIRYLASQQLLIPLLERVPENLSMNELQLSDFLNPKECLKLLQKIGKDLVRLYFYRPSLPVSIKKLAELAPHLKDIEANEPLTSNELHQLIAHYPKIERIGPTALSGIDKATLRKLLEECKGLTDLDCVLPLAMADDTAAPFFYGISSSALMTLRISNKFKDAFAFAARCPNLTSLEITEIDADDPLITTLQQCSNLTELFLPEVIGDTVTEDSNEKHVTTHFKSFDKITKVTGNIASIQKCFSVTFPNAEIWLTLTDTETNSIKTKTFFETHQNIKSITYLEYNSDYRDDFQQYLELSRDSLTSLTLGKHHNHRKRAVDKDVDLILSHCKKLDSFTCSGPTLTSAALIRLFEATELKKVGLHNMENCNDQVIQSLLEKSGKSLVHLRIFDCPIDSMSLRIIEQLGIGLKKLCLADCNEIWGEELANLVQWTPNLKVAMFGTPDLSNEHVALMSHRLPHLRRVAFFVNESLNIKNACDCFSEDIAIEFWRIGLWGQVKDPLIFQNEKANSRNPEHKPKFGFWSYVIINGGFFRGYVKSGQADGKGKITLANGVTYEGNWRNGMKHGFGKCTRPDSSTEEREYFDGRLVNILPSNSDATELEEQCMQVEGEGKDSEQSDETESRGQKTKRAELRKTESEANEAAPPTKRIRKSEEKKGVDTISAPEEPESK